ncbi:hemolysin family protein [Tepidibacillus fermentans]|uniref:CBS domain containing-hemolysin-like protein n=1 Tax=Tepidibacillus fermentans TaxID=1281767 RepID=A0A4R3KJK6_9BACI|nr:hemolysin family protein [Tepidibacillus fermentans]TCS83789.1 CBS domain containing-hemolysin-like protein [Tepidibacillus fermentans]
MQLLYIVLTIFFIFFSAFFVAAEFAIVKVRESRIDQLIANGNRKALHTKKIIHNLNEYLSTAQVGITLSSLALGWLGEPTFYELLLPIFERFHLPTQIQSTISFIVAFTLITYLHVVLGELTPKTIAIIKAEPLALATARPLIFFHTILFPFVWLLNGSANLLVRLMGFPTISEHDNVHSEEELKHILSRSYESGEINQTEYDYVNNIFEFDNRVAKEIMIPRTEMVCLYNNLSFEENLEIIEKEKFTRYPFVQDDKDHLIGIVNSKELILDYIKGKHQALETYAHPALMAIETTPVHELLKRMQKERTEMAILLDEYGGTAGLVTLEDMLEEIVGEIRDEFDQEERPMIEEIAENEYLVDGKVLLEDIEEKFGINLKNDEDMDTIGGWLYSKLPDVHEGSQIDFEDIVFTIEKMDRFRISKIHIRTNEEHMPLEN